MTAKTVLNIHPKVFAAVAAGAGYSVLTAVGTHLDQHLLGFLPPEYQAAATSLAGVLIAGAAGWLKKESATETSAEQTVSADAAKTAEDVVSHIIPVTFKSAAPSE